MRNFIHKRLITCTSLWMLVFCSKGYSTTYSWLGTTSSDLTLPANWSAGVPPGPPGPPGPADTGTFTTSISTSPSVSAVTMNTGNFLITGPAVFNFAVTGGSGALNFNLTNGLTNSSGVTQNAGISGGGTVSFVANTVPGNSSPVAYSLNGGKLTFNGNYTDSTFTNVTMQNGSTLNVLGGGLVSINSLTTDLLSTVALGTGTLTLNPLTTNTLTGPITGGAGTLSVQGTGSKVILANPVPSSNTYAHNVIGAGATLQGTPDNVEGDVNINIGGTLDFEQAAFTSGDFNGNIFGGGNLTINNAGNVGTVQLGGTNTYTGTTTITAGTLELSTFAAVQGSSAIIDNGTLELAAIGSYSGPVSGTGGVIASSPGVAQLSGPVTYQGTTVVNTGTLELDNLSTLPGAITLMPGAFIDFNQVPLNPAIISGPITGAGGVIINGNGASGRVIFTNSSNTYTGGTTILNGTLQTAPATQPGDIVVVDPGTIDFEQPASTRGTFTGKISGTGHVAINQAGSTGTVLLGNNANSYSGKTTIYNGTLEVKDLIGISTSTLDVKETGTLVFDQTSNGTLLNVLQGKGLVVKKGSATLKYGIDENGFEGLTDIQEGTLHIDHNLGGNAVARRHSLLKGKGKILGNLHISESSAIAPGDGNSIDTFSVGGNYKQSGRSTYFVNANVLPNQTVQSSLIKVGGAAEIVNGLIDPFNFAVANHCDEHRDGRLESGTIVNVNVTGTGQLPLNTTASSVILHADGGVSGKFSSIVSNFPLLTPKLSYGPNDVFLNFVNTLQVLPVTYNERQVAEQLQRITNPTPQQMNILVGITSLPKGEAREALDQLTGEQYTSTLLAAELSSRGFIRRMFDPMRLTINYPYEERNCCKSLFEVDTWGEASLHQAWLQTGQNFHKVEIDGYELSIGGQMSVLDHLTVGGAYSYENDFTEYHVGGSGKTMVNLGGAYALFRPSCYYVLGEFVGGCSHNKIRRHINIGTIHYRPLANVRVWQASYYVEAGKDFLWKYVLAQPFIGYEGGHYRFDNFTEKGNTPLNLSVRNKKVDPSYARCGVHLTTRNRPMWWSFGVDLAWMYRLTSPGTSIHERFVSFGVPFDIKGAHLQRNSFEAAGNFSVAFCSNWEVFGEVSSQTWTNAITYSCLLGISSVW